MASRSSSPSSIPLPVSPVDSQSEFDDLIELLAADEQGSGGWKSNLDLTQDNHPDLRDQEGRLDFSKIRALFSSPSDGSTYTLPATMRPDMDHTRLAGGSRNNVEMIPDQSFRAAHSSRLNNVNKYSPNSVLPTSEISSLALSLPTENQIVFEAGLPPAESTPRIVRTRQDANVASSSSVGPPWSTKLDEMDIPRIERDQTFRNIQQEPRSVTSSLLVLKQALGLAHQEVTDLRERCRELEELVHARQVTALSGKNEMASKPSSNGANPQFDFRDSDGFSEAHNVEALSPAQTRAALKSLLKCLSLPESCIMSLVTEDFQPPTISPSALDDIRRSMDTVAILDELVWKRSRFGAKYENLYGEENIQALRDRLELWERAVRTRR